MTTARVQPEPESLPLRPEGEPGRDRIRAWLEKRLAWLAIDPVSAVLVGAKIAPVLIAGYTALQKRDKPELIVHQGKLLGDQWGEVPTALYPVRACNNRDYRISVEGNGLLLYNPGQKPSWKSRILLSRPVKWLGLFPHVPPGLQYLPWSGHGRKGHQRWRRILEHENACLPEDQRETGEIGEITCVRLAEVLSEFGIRAPQEVWVYYLAEIKNDKRAFFSNMEVLNIGDLAAQARAAQRKN